MPRHFLTGAELSTAEIDALLDRALELKRAPFASQALANRSVGLIFQKPSTRTRVSFEVGISELGGHAVVLRSDELQMSRGEALRDTAIVLSRHLAALGVRSGADETVRELARYSAIPVINMLTPLHHPCQALADLLTLREAYGTLEGLRLAYIGDGNNVARSLALLGTLAGVDVAVASPQSYALEHDLALAEGTAAGTERAAARPRPGDVLELQVDSLAFGGEGVARLGDNGYVVFVAGAIPGDRVRAVVYKRKRSYAHARVVDVLAPSRERVAPRAQHPGVAWQVLPYERQLQIKRAQVEEALRRLGGLDGF